jgi:hypothetical protein
VHGETHPSTPKRVLADAASTKVFVTELADVKFGVLLATRSRARMQLSRVMQKSYHIGNTVTDSLMCVGENIDITE